MWSTSTGPRPQRLTECSICAASFDLPSSGDMRSTTLRWAVYHLIEETARHVGHMDITRELLDGSTGR